VKNFVLREVKRSSTNGKQQATALRPENNLFSTAADNAIYTWEYESFKLIGVCFTENPVISLRFVLNGERLYLVAYDGKITFFEVQGSFIYIFYKPAIVIDCQSMTEKFCLIDIEPISFYKDLKPCESKA
jgi:WD40 repeat protein